MGTLRAGSSEFERVPFSGVSDVANETSVNGVRHRDLTLPASRREFLHRIGAGFGTLGLAACSRTRASCHPSGPPLPRFRRRNAADPFAPRAPHFAPKAKRVIQLFMPGGPRRSTPSTTSRPFARTPTAAEAGRQEVAPQHEDGPHALALRFQALRRMRQDGERHLSEGRGARDKIVSSTRCTRTSPSTPAPSS